jgi:hypothetical protein
MNKKSPLLVGALVFVAFFFFPLNASAQTKPQRIKFRKGATSATVSGSIIGYATKDYVLRAGEGQTMTVRINSPKAYFVIYSINGRSNDMIETTEWSDVLSESGDYVIRVFMMRADARRKGATTNYTLKVSIE